MKRPDKMQYNKYKLVIYNKLIESETCWYLILPLTVNKAPNIITEFSVGIKLM